ncbi:hypothetical protein DB345_05055 [Spartobacteria bacterium LR76]|nr:hypothetical protein DB345_05055 [Spartobacteria bacterium LR76]
MKTLATFLGAVVLAFSLNACGMLQAKYDANGKATAAYLQSKNTGSPRTNVEGLWYSPQWGAVLLNQTPKGELTGVFQDVYRVQGWVVGKSASFVLIDDDWTEYTVELQRQSTEKLSGFYSPSVPFSDKDKTPMDLYRIDR